MVNRKDLNPDSSPQAAFGARLRRLREERGWKQDELSSLMGYSGTHISCVETGRKMPTLRFSRRADTAFGIEGTERSFEREWREIKYGSLLEGFPEYVRYEGRAVEVRLYEVGVIPGLLQTRDYARVLADSHVSRGAISSEQAAERVSYLMERQASVWRERPPMMLVVMDESCLRRLVGGRMVMREQLDYLLELAELPNTVIQIAPYAMGERRPFDLPINLLTLSDMSGVAYAEAQIRGHVERETSVVLSLLTAYHQLQAEALPQATSVAMIDEVRRGIS